MARFSEGLSLASLLAVLARYGVWTGTHLAILLGLLHLERSDSVSETVITVAMGPVGLVDFALLVHGARSLRAFNWRTVLQFLCVVGNFLAYASISLQMRSLAGPMVEIDGPGPGGEGPLGVSRPAAPTAAGFAVGPDVV